MKTTGIRLFGMVCGMVVMLCTLSPLQAQPQCEVEQREHHFGEIGERGGTVSHTFRIKNSGDQPLVFRKAEVNCKCTRVDFPRRPVMPGTEADVVVSYDPKRQAGMFNKAISLYSNIPDQRTILIISGRVVP